jgi:hypothetical protein
MGGIQKWRHSRFYALVRRALIGPRLNHNGRISSPQLVRPFTIAK